MPSDWLLRNADRLGLRAADRLHLCGTSAGAHLAAMAMLPAPLGPDVSGRIAGALLLSGMYDLEPVRLSYVNEALRLDEAGARRNSPIQLLPERLPDVVIAIGGNETEEYVRQHQRMATALRPRAATREIVAERRNHFDLPTNLGVRGTELGDAVLAQMRLGGASKMSTESHRTHRTHRRQPKTPTTAPGTAFVVRCRPGPRRAAPRTRTTRGWTSCWRCNIRSARRTPSRVHHHEPGQGTAVQAAAHRTDHGARAIVKDRLGEALWDAAPVEPGAAGAAGLLGDVLRVVAGGIRRVSGRLGSASGFQSAGYRRLEFLLGNKNETMAAPHRDTVGHEAVLRQLHEPSLYDEALALLVRRGLLTPDDSPARDATLPYRTGSEVEAAWRTIYRDPVRHQRPAPARRGADGHRRAVLALALYTSAHRAADVGREAGHRRHRGRGLARPISEHRFFPGAVVGALDALTRGATTASRP